MPKQKSILIVDDDLSIREMLCDFLSAEGFMVLVAEDGQQALRLASEKVPDLIIIDLLLPREHGLEVIRDIKDKCFIPVIAISGIYSTLEVKRELDDFYLDGFIPKPIDLDILRERIRNILNG